MFSEVSSILMLPGKRTGKKARTEAAKIVTSAKYPPLGGRLLAETEKTIGIPGNLA